MKTSDFDIPAIQLRVARLELLLGELLANVSEQELQCRFCGRPVADHDAGCPVPLATEVIAGSYLMKLCDPAFQLGIMCLPPSPMATCLRNSDEVKFVKAAIKTRVQVAGDEVVAEQVNAFVKALMSFFQPGTKFRYDSELAALAVAIEDWDCPFSRKLLTELAALNVAGMPMAPRVARSILEKKPPPTRRETP